MHILYIHQYFVTPNESLGTRSYELAKGLINEGHKVTMLTSDFTNKYTTKVTRKTIEGIDVIYLRNSYSSKMSFLRRIFSFISFMVKCMRYVIKIKDVNLVYATSTPLTVGLIGLFKKRVSKVPFIFEVRDLWPELPIAMGIIKNKLIISILESFEKKLYRSADHLVALSPGMKEGIIAKGGNDKKVTLIPNGCDLDKFYPRQGAVDRKLLPFKNSDFVLIFSGAHGIANGLDYVLNLAEETLKQNFDHIKYVLIGDGGKKGELKTAVETKKLTNILMLDPIPKKNLVNYFHESNMGMQILANIEAFQYGTSPNKFFDYISSGLPVLNNYKGWVADMLIENACGIVVNGNFKESVDKINDLSKNNLELQKMGDNCLLLAKDEFKREILFDKFYNVIQSV